jgi:two-component sensor histidine kinase
MLLDIRLPLARSGADGVAYVVRVVRAVDRRRLAAVALVTLLLSLTPLFGSALLDFFSPAELALAWFEHLVELAVLAAALTAAYTLLDEALPRRTPLQLAILCVMLFGLSVVLTLLLYGYYAHGFEHLPPPLRLLFDSLRLGVPAVFLALIADVHRRALQSDSAARAAEMLSAHWSQAESEQQLALLQAQIEPHFLFNVLGNVRRLYRTQPQAGSDAIASLMRYLRAALPQLRSQRGSLEDEFELVRAYLDLFQVRMGARLTFSLEADPTLLEAEFPPMLLITLVENAIKHGLEPARGGHVLVRARRRRRMLEVTVLDDGAGFGAAASAGTGVGLANVRRQLAARYKSQARLTLVARAPRGASASILIPLRAATAPDSGRWRLPTAVWKAT